MPGVDRIALASEPFCGGLATKGFTMPKEGIHPKYHDVDARCACGATWLRPFRIERTMSGAQT